MSQYGENRVPADEQPTIQMAAVSVPAEERPTIQIAAVSLPTEQRSGHVRGATAPVPHPRGEHIGWPPHRRRRRPDSRQRRLRRSSGWRSIGWRSSFRWCCCRWRRPRSAERRRRCRRCRYDDTADGRTRVPVVENPPHHRQRPDEGYAGHCSRSHGRRARRRRRHRGGYRTPARCPGAPTCSASTWAARVARRPSRRCGPSGPRREHVTTPVPVRIGERTGEITPADVGLAVDVEATVAAAARATRADQPAVRLPEAAAGRHGGRGTAGHRAAEDPRQDGAR